MDNRKRKCKEKMEITEEKMQQKDHGIWKGEFGLLIPLSPAFDEQKQKSKIVRLQFLSRASIDSKDTLPGE